MSKTYGHEMHRAPLRLERDVLERIVYESVSVLQNIQLPTSSVSQGAFLQR